MKKSIEYKDCLTNEILNKKFNNQFEMVAEAIQRALYHISIDRDDHVKYCNVSFHVLSEMAKENN